MLMIEAEDSMRILDTIAKNLIGVSNNRSNFERLPDTFWGYYARGHNGKGRFGVIVVYSESGSRNFAIAISSDCLTNAGSLTCH